MIFRKLWIRFYFYYMTPVIGAFLAFLWFDVFRIRRKVVLENIKIAYGDQRIFNSRGESLTATQLGRQSLRNLGRTFSEYLLLPFLAKDPKALAITIEGEENLKGAIAKAEAEGKTILLMGMHVGNGDLALALLSGLGLKASLISKTFKLQWLNRVWFGLREKMGMQFIAPERSSFEILKALRQKRIVVFVLDQFMGPPVGCRTKFFGKVTGTAMGLAVFAERTGAPVVPCYSYRKPNGDIVAGFLPAIEWGQGLDQGLKADRDANIIAMTQVFTDKIEEVVRKYPEFWMWIHRRWKEFRD